MKQRVFTAMSPSSHTELFAKQQQQQQQKKKHQNQSKINRVYLSHYSSAYLIVVALQAVACSTVIIITGKY